MNLILPIAVEVHAARRALVSREWHGAGYSDGYARIYRPEAGAGSVAHHGEIFPLMPGYCYYIPSYSVQDYSCADAMALHYIHFTAAGVGGMSVEPLLRCRYRAEDDGTFMRLLRRLEEQWATASTAARVECQGIAMQLFARFIEGRRDEENPDAQEILRYRRVFEYIDRCSGQSIRVHELAGVMGLDRSYFSRRFTRLFGVSPQRYILRRKIEQASTLMRDPSLTLGDIASSLGFSDAFHLSKTFRNLTGLSPADFRSSKLLGP